MQVWATRAKHCRSQPLDWEEGVGCQRRRVLLSEERLDRFFASSVSLAVLSGDTATEGTVLIEMDDIDEATGSDEVEIGPRPRKQTRN